MSWPVSFALRPNWVGGPASAEHLRVETNRVSKMLTQLITFLRNQPAWRNKEGHP